MQNAKSDPDDDPRSGMRIASKLHACDRDRKNQSLVLVLGSADFAERHSPIASVVEFLGFPSRPPLCAVPASVCARRKTRSRGKGAR